MSDERANAVAGGGAGAAVAGVGEAVVGVLGCAVMDEAEAESDLAVGKEKPKMSGNNSVLLVLYFSSISSSTTNLVILSMLRFLPVFRQSSLK